MKRDTHTPGPWTIGRGPTSNDVFVQGEQGMRTVWLAQVYNADDDTRLPQKANAKLLAAAPDLLRACKRMLRALEMRGTGKLATEIPAAADLRAAIAKAEGE